MTKYDVTIKREDLFLVTVEASSGEEAQEIALQEWGYSLQPWHDYGFHSSGGEIENVKRRD